MTSTFEPQPVQLNYFNYFTEIEETFVRRRGKHLWLSTVDWALMESWKDRNIPLHVALNGIERAFDSFESKPRHRSVKTLLYCQEEVEAQFAEWQEGRVGAKIEAGVADADNPGSGPEPFPFPLDTICEHLRRSKSELDARISAMEAPEDRQLVEAFARASARLSELEQDLTGQGGLSAKRLEDSLTRIEAMLDDAIDLNVKPKTVDIVRNYAAQQLEAYRKRMDKETYSQTVATVFRKRLREEFGLPRLSLFYL